MSDEFFPTTPNLPVDSGIVSTPKAFSDSLTQDLTDEEIKHLLTTVMRIREKWLRTFRSKFRDDKFTVEQAVDHVDKMEDEIAYELATKHDILASVDCTPIFEGLPPVVEIMGALSSHTSAKYGFDHEQKEWEVKKATQRGEDFLGAKEEANATKAKKRAK